MQDEQHAQTHQRRKQVEMVVALDLLHRIEEESKRLMKDDDGAED